MIVAAAIKFGDLVCHVPQPGRHATVLHRLHSLWRQGGPNPDFLHAQETQGFLNDKGEFLNRSDAYKHAIECGQGLPRRTEILQRSLTAYNGTELFSEDLW